MTYLAELIRGVKAPKPSTEKHSRCSWLETGRWSNDGAEKDVSFDCKYNASVSCIYPQIVTAMSLTGLKVGPGETSTALLSFRVKKRKERWIKRVKAEISFLQNSFPWLCCFSSGSRWTGLRVRRLKKMWDVFQRGDSSSSFTVSFLRNLQCGALHRPHKMRPV